MKKKLIAKLLVLGLILAMLPTAAFASNKTKVIDADKVVYNNGVYWYGGHKVVWNEQNQNYYYASEDTASDVGGGSAGGGSSSSTDANTSTSTDKTEVPTVIDTIDEIKVEQVVVTAEGTTVTIKATVKDGVASVALTEAALESLAEQVEGSTLILVIDAESATKVAVSLPGKALAALAEKTGVDLVLKTPVATITIPNAALIGLKDAATVAIVAEVNEGAFVIAVMADGKAINDKIEGLVVKF